MWLGFTPGLSDRHLRAVPSVSRRHRASHRAAGRRPRRRRIQFDRTSSVCIRLLFRARRSSIRASSCGRQRRGRARSTASARTLGPVRCVLCADGVWPLIVQWWHPSSRRRWRRSPAARRSGTRGFWAERVTTSCCTSAASSTARWRASVSAAPMRSWCRAPTIWRWWKALPARRGCSRRCAVFVLRARQGRCGHAAGDRDALRARLGLTGPTALFFG